MSHTLGGWSFLVRTGVLFLGLTLLWIPVSDWTSYAAGTVAQVLLDSQADNWIESTRNEPGALKAKLRFSHILADQRVATPIANVKPAHYAYGTSLLLALLLASRSPKFWRRASLGALVLLLPQALSLVSVILYQIIRAVPLALLKVSPFQLDAIALGQLFGTLVLPTLAPVMVWAWLDRESIAHWP